MKALLIMLHGSGGNGPSLRLFLESIPLEDFECQTFRQIADLIGMDILTPTAPLRHYAPCGNEQLNVWFNRSEHFQSEGLDSLEDAESIEDSVQKIVDIIEDNAPSYSKIIIGGFSMGGCLALHLLNRDLNPAVCGLFSMGSFLPRTSSVFSAPLGSTSNIPVLMLHGQEDLLISHEWGNATATGLLLRQINVHFQSYAGVEHDISDSELSDIMHWAEDILIQSQDLSDSFCTSASALIRSSPEEYVQHEGPIQYSIKTEEPGYFKICFKLPAEMISIAISRPVLACGGIFEFVSNSNGVETIACTSDPHNLAVELAKRLRLRFSDGESTNPCPIS